LVGRHKCGWRRVSGGGGSYGRRRRRRRSGGGAMEFVIVERGCGSIMRTIGVDRMVEEIGSFHPSHSLRGDGDGLEQGAGVGEGLEKMVIEHMGADRRISRRMIQKKMMMMMMMMVRMMMGVVAGLG
jgi:hypothetical protein